MAATPPVTNGLIAHHDAREITASDGDTVSSWTDESGNSNAASTNNPDGTDYTPPLYKTGQTPSGDPALKFEPINGGKEDDSFSARFLRWPNNLLDIRSGTTFVYSSQTNDDTQGFVISGYEDDAWAGDYQLQYSTDDNNNGIYKCTIAGGSGNVQIVQDEFKVLALRLDGDQKDAFVSTSNEFSFTDTALQPSIYKNGIGALMEGGGGSDGALWFTNNNALDGHIALILHYNRALSDTEVNDVVTWIEDELSSGGGASESLAWSATGTPSLAESGGASETPTWNAVGSSSVVESSSASESATLESSGAFSLTDSSSVLEAAFLSSTAAWGLVERTVTLQTESLSFSATGSLSTSEVASVSEELSWTAVVQFILEEKISIFERVSFAALVSWKIVESTGIVATRRISKIGRNAVELLTRPFNKVERKDE